MSLEEVINVDNDVASDTVYKLSHIPKYRESRSVHLEKVSWSLRYFLRRYHIFDKKCKSLQFLYYF